MKADVVDELFKKYYNEALLYTVTICGERALAEDIVQTAFFKALQSADGAIMDFKPWLLTVCRNEYYGVLRKRKQLSDGELDESFPDEREDMLERVIRQEQYQRLYRAISRLKRNQREVIELFYFSGLPVRDIALVTGSSEANVKVLLYRARLALRGLMEGNDK